MNDWADKEKDFNSWLDSIEFIDKTGKKISLPLQKDDSDDPEDDRAEG